MPAPSRKRPTRQRRSDLHRFLTAASASATAAGAGRRRRTRTVVVVVVVVVVAGTAAATFAAAERVHVGPARLGRQRLAWNCTQTPARERKRR